MMSRMRSINVSSGLQCKHAYIVPQKFTLANARMFSDYHLLLAHEIALMSPDARTKCFSFWRTAQSFGHFIMLDNGAYELGAAMDDAVFAQMCYALNPNEVILPDVLYDRDASMLRAAQFCRTHSALFSQEISGHESHRVRKAAVLQLDTRGSADTPISMDAIEEQLQFYHRQLDVSTICIPRHFGHGRIYGRTTFVEAFHQFLMRHPYWLDVFNFHMLGLACLPELLVFPRYYWIRGVDTAVQFVYAYNGHLLRDCMDVVINKCCKRPQAFFDLAALNSQARSMFMANVMFTRKIMRYEARSGRCGFGQH